MIAAIVESQTWRQAVTQLLDDHHLAAVSDDGAARRAFGDELGNQLALVQNSEIVEIDGSTAIDVQSFCAQFEAKMSGTGAVGDGLPSIRRIIELMRCASASMRRFVIWHDADALLEADAGLFAKVVNAMIGVAAECEYVSADRLLVQRVVFLGGSRLGDYAEDVTGQFHRWLPVEDESALWDVMSVVPRPPVVVHRIAGGG